MCTFPCSIMQTAKCPTGEKFPLKNTASLFGGWEHIKTFKIHHSKDSVPTSIHPLLINIAHLRSASRFVHISKPNSSTNFSNRLSSLILYYENVKVVLSFNEHELGVFVEYSLTQNFNPHHSISRSNSPCLYNSLTTRRSLPGVSRHDAILTNMARQKHARFRCRYWYRSIGRIPIRIRMLCSVLLCPVLHRPVPSPRFARGCLHLIPAIGLCINGLDSVHTGFTPNTLL